jgi:hypothetical protein
MAGKVKSQGPSRMMSVSGRPVAFSHNHFYTNSARSSMTFYRRRSVILESAVAGNAAVPSLPARRVRGSSGRHQLATVCRGRPAPCQAATGQVLGR